LIYRGFALNGLISKGMSRWLALPVSAVSFALMHGPATVLFPGMSSSLLVFGFLMGGLLLWVKRLWAPMAFHMWYDFLLFYIPFFFTTNFSDINLSRYTPENAMAYDSAVFNLSAADTLPDCVRLFDDKKSGGNSDITAVLIKDNTGDTYIHLTGHIVKKGYLGYAGLNFILSKENDTTPVMINGYKGIEFYAKGNGSTYFLMLISGLVKDNNYHYSSFITSKDWEKIRLPFENMKQKILIGKAVPLNLKTIIGIDFVADNRNHEIDLDIKDIGLYK